MIRWTAVGALTGLVVALALALAMPTRYTATLVVQAPGTGRLSVPPGATYTPRAQLYGAMGPGQAPASVTYTATASTRRRALALVSSGRHGGHESLSVNVSPRTVRDLVLGLIAGAMVALALLTTRLGWRASSRW